MVPVSSTTSDGERAVSLLSGGLDSVVSTFMAAQDVEIALAITCDYGQHAAEAEMRAAGKFAALLGIPHEVVPLPWLARIASGALTDQSRLLPHPDEIDLDGPHSHATASAVWVPNRNGLLVNIAAVYAEAIGCGHIICGFNAEEAATFPDNSIEFVAATNEMLRFSTQNSPRLLCPTLQMTKAEILAIGERLQVPLQLVWSCYEAGPTPCGRCESCMRLQRARNHMP